MPHQSYLTQFPNSKFGVIISREERPCDEGAVEVEQRLILRGRDGPCCYLEFIYLWNESVSWRHASTHDIHVAVASIQNLIEAGRDMRTISKAFHKHA